MDEHARDDDRAAGAERRRLENQRRGAENWRLWGPYLAERAWGTVREDYGAGGDAWSFLPHEHARARAYRWSEDGLGGICDENQTLCFALALWNGRDPILKERAFGLTGAQGNRGEDVKEYYFYLDATPSHSYLRYLYKYPQTAFPYAALVEENARRSRFDPPFGLLEAGAFAENRYFDIGVTYAKAGVDEIHIRIDAANRGPETAELHLLPTLWFRNTWSWGEPGDNAGGEAERGSEEASRRGERKPEIRAQSAPLGAAWCVRADHSDLGHYFLYGRQAARELFCENDTNSDRLFGIGNAGASAKDAFHDRVVGGDASAVNAAKAGSKFAAWHGYDVPAGHSVRVDLVLSAKSLSTPFARTEVILATRRSEADVFFHDLQPAARPEDQGIIRQALAGVIWTKQFYHYDVERWLQGDLFPPPASRLDGRNRGWKTLKARDIISMPDAWEYPWFAAWDLAFHCSALALIDIDFAKDQVELMVSERYLNPNGQIPAYEWNFGDVNPPVHAMAALKAFRAERVQRGVGDHGFLKRVFHKLLLNYAWWINRKDADGQNVFEGGFLGLDNISVTDRSHPLPFGYSLKQADATGWMAMFALDMTVIALELNAIDPEYEDIAILTYEQFLAIADAIGGHSGAGVSLWDPESGFFKDLIVTPDGGVHRIDVYSMVGLIPLFATEVVDERLLAHAPRFKAGLHMHKGGTFQGHHICACPDAENARGEHLLALVDHTMLPRILTRLLDERQFLSPHGVRSVSKIHADRRNLGTLPGIGEAVIEYVPGESTSPMFGGNSNWRGPVWLPVNYLLIQSIERFHRFLGEDFRVPVPCLGGRTLSLREIATLVAERIVDMYRHTGERTAGGGRGAVPALADQPPFAMDPHWRDLLLFYEYFHAETGQGLGAAHQTGWTALIANLVMRRYRRDIPAYWRGAHGAGAPAASDPERPAGP
ncbi:MAG: glucosidase [Rhodospirillales bacterium]|nr:glucosidase [Rhodospirillales bacterium]